jgi:hypothetical protein
MGVLCRLVLLLLHLKEAAGETSLTASLLGEVDRVLFLVGLGIYDFFTELNMWGEVSLCDTPPTDMI